MAGKGLRGAAVITHNLKEYGGGSMAKGLERLAAESKKAGILEERARNTSLFSKLLGNVLKVRK